MDELIPIGECFVKTSETDGGSYCPVDHAGGNKRLLDMDEELVFPNHRRSFIHYSQEEDGSTQLNIYCGEKEIAFDEIDLFPFGERLTRQNRFLAGSATLWGEGYPWERIRELLEQLIEEGVLQRARDAAAEVPTHCGPRPSPLPPAPARAPRTWLDCEAITAELTGKPLELGYLECAVPVFRVAHMALDAEGRQVGEANVFPARLRVDVPTDWRSCPHQGSRYEHEKPMNVTALKSMRHHWPQMLETLGRIKQAYAGRFPKTGKDWTVGELHRLSTLVLALPGYLLLRSENPVQAGRLHPVLSCLFRVTDGVQMSTSIMLYTAEDEPTRFPQARLTASELYAYAERNDLFVSTHGVCAGPPAMVQEFLQALTAEPADTGAGTLAPDVEAALGDLEPAFDYGLLGLKTHALVFSLWPLMGAAYQELDEVLKGWPGGCPEPLRALQARLAESLEFLLGSNGLSMAEWRIRRERVYEDMFSQCSKGLGSRYPSPSLAECLAAESTAPHERLEEELAAFLGGRLGSSTPETSLQIQAWAKVLTDYFAVEQAVVRAVTAIQGQINALLGRPQPVRLLKGSDLTLFYGLRGGNFPQPYLGDDLRESLGIEFVVTDAAIGFFRVETACPVSGI